MSILDVVNTMAAGVHFCDTAGHACALSAFFGSFCNDFVAAKMPGQ